MKKSSALILIGAVLSILALSACGGQEVVPTSAAAPIPTSEPEATAAPTEAPVPTPVPIVLVDGLGREVTLAGPAKRIVSLAPSNTEILFALGAEDLVVGREDTADYPVGALDIPSIGSLFGDINTEVIVALEPDLALAAGIITPEQVQAIEAIGVPVFSLGDPMGFDALYENLRIVGLLTGREAEAARLIEDLRARVDAVLATVTDADPVKVYYEVDGTDPSSPWTTGSGTFQDVLIGLAAGTNVVSDIQGWGQINVEELVSRDPDIIIFGEGPWVPTTPESLSARAGWSGIAAVVNGSVHGIDTNWVDRPGPRLVDAFETIARLLHPELFE